MRPWTSAANASQPGLVEHKLPVLLPGAPRGRRLKHTGVNVPAALFESDSEYHRSSQP
jgi:hypothetical protein